MARINADSPLYRQLLNQIAEKKDAGFRFTDTPQGRHGIDATDIIFTDWQKAQELGVKLDAASGGKPQLISTKLADLISQIMKTAGDHRAQKSCRGSKPRYCGGDAARI